MELAEGFKKFTPAMRRGARRMISGAAAAAAALAMAAGCSTPKPAPRRAAPVAPDVAPAVARSAAGRSHGDASLEGSTPGDAAIIEGALPLDSTRIVQGIDNAAPTTLLDQPNASTRPLWNEAAELASGRRFEPIHFEFDSIEISGPARRMLEEYAKWLQENPSVLMNIAGHCDKDGSEEYNYNLGMARAQAARGVMVTAGVRADRIFTVSYGEERPAAPEFTPADKALNRRAEFRAYESSAMEIQQVPASANAPPPSPAEPPPPPKGEETP